MDSIQETGGVKRCAWCGDDPLYRDYHDREWGRLVEDDAVMFEFLTLESAQAGLSWLTILRKRENYRRAFAGFDAERVAAFTDDDVERLLSSDSGVIRNRLKVRAAVTNARAFLEVRREFGSFCAYLRGFLPEGRPVVNSWTSAADCPASTPLSDAISRDMRRRGFKFFGTTICYAHLQAVGYVNDHHVDCHFKFQGRGDFADLAAKTETHEIHNAHDKD